MTTSFSRHELVSNLALFNAAYTSYRAALRAGEHVSTSYYKSETDAWAGWFVEQHVLLCYDTTTEMYTLGSEDEP